MKLRKLFWILSNTERLFNALHILRCIVLPEVVWGRQYVYVYKFTWLFCDEFLIMMKENKYRLLTSFNDEVYCSLVHVTLPLDVKLLSRHHISRLVLKGLCTGHLSKDLSKPGGKYDDERVICVGVIVGVGHCTILLTLSHTQPHKLCPPHIITL